MPESGKRIFASSGISSSLDTVLGPVIGATYSSRLTNFKKSNPNLLSDKSLSNNSSKSSSGSSLTLTNNNNTNSSVNNNVTSLKFPHHQFYNSQISTSNNWNNINVRSNSLCSQKVSNWMIWRPYQYSNIVLQFWCLIAINCLRKQIKFSRLAVTTWFSPNVQRNSEMKLKFILFRQTKSTLDLWYFKILRIRLYSGAYINYISNSRFFLFTNQILKRAESFFLSRLSSSRLPQNIEL